MAEDVNMPDQPDGIDSDTHDLPTPANAAKRVGEYLEWWGDGLIDTAGPNAGYAAAPLYARDLEVLVNAVRDLRADARAIAAYRDERDLLLWLHAEAVWELSELAARFEDAVEINRLSLQQVLTERDEAEASRRDWAAEALRLEMAAEVAMAEVLKAVIGDIEAEAAFRAPVGLADPNEISHEDLVAAQALREYAERLRTHPSLSRPVCAVHPEGRDE